MRLPDALRRAGDSVVGGASVALAVQLVTYSLGLLGSVLIARALGAEGRGAYFLPVTAALTVVVLMNLAVEVANTYLHAEARISLPDLVRASTTIALLVAFPTLALMSGVYLLERDDLLSGVSAGAYAAVAVAALLNLHLLWLAGAFLLDKRLPRSQIASLIGGVAQFVGIAVLWAFNALTVDAVLLLGAGAVLIPWLLHVIWAQAFVPVRIGTDWALIRRILATGLRLHLGFVFMFLLLRADVFLVGEQLGTREVGVYSLSVLFAELIWLLINPLVIAVLPFQAESSREEAGRLSFKAARFNLLLGAAIAAAFAAGGWLLIPLVYGEEFRGAYAALMALLPGVFGMTVSRSLANWLVRQGRPIVYTALAGIAFAFNLALNLLLLEPLGIVGASIASSLAYLALAAAHVWWGLRVSGLRLREALGPHPGDAATIRQLLRR